jgi:redox-sensitive bicupin YhaK (pirin superfamily)
MSAGAGIRHSEFNASDKEPVRFLQIWLLPDSNGTPPSYEEKNFADRAGVLRLVASRDGRDGSVTINSDVDLYASVLAKGSEAKHAFAKGRLGWVQVARGSVEVNGVTLEEGDGLAIADENAIILSARNGETELLVFDMAR